MMNGNNNTMMSGTIDNNTNNGPVFSAAAQAMMVCLLISTLHFVYVLSHIHKFILALHRKKWVMLMDKVWVKTQEELQNRFEHLIVSQLVADWGMIQN